MAARLVARELGLAELNAGGAAGGLAERVFGQGTEGFAVEREPLLLLHESHLSFLELQRYRSAAGAWRRATAAVSPIALHHEPAHI
jgi:hypothetical protein